MDSLAVVTLLDLIPTEVKESCVDDQTGHIIASKPFKKEEIEWLHATVRNCMIMAATEKECNVEYYSIPPKCKMKGVMQYNTKAVSTDSLITCRVDDGRVVVRLDNTIETFLDGLVACVTDPSGYVLYISDAADVNIFASSALLDARSVFLIYKHRFELAGLHKFVELAKKRTMFTIREIGKQFCEHPHLYRMYLSSSILSMGACYEIDYGDMSVETTQKLCAEYYHVLEDEVSTMR